MGQSPKSQSHHFIPHDANIERVRKSFERVRESKKQESEKNQQFVEIKPEELAK
ncbi:hypothetical protein [Corallincola luteus]|uniref:hypothetical protein n=1 Tax=Corallincola luteus TaxID=1775177 RepID=UPI0013F48C59|nr:hypothetical protein [Corallincola luteus]